MYPGDPYRAATPRTQLWAPGVLFMRDGQPSLIEHGPTAGWYRSFDDIHDWKSEVLLVERANLDAAIAKSGLQRDAILPECLLDSPSTPRLLAVALAAPLVAVDETQWQPLVAAGARGYVIGFHRVSGGFWFTATGGDRPDVGEGGEEGEVIDEFSPPRPPRVDQDEEPEYVEPPELRWLRGPRGFLDRIFRAQSDGVVTENAIHWAIALRQLPDPLFRMRRRSPSSKSFRRTPDEARHAARGWEAEMAQVVERNQPMLPLAQSLAAAIANAPPDVDTLTIAPYVVRRERMPEARRRTDGLVLAAEDLWYVDAIEAWGPTLDPALVAELDAEQRAAMKHSVAAGAELDRHEGRQAAAFLFGLALLGAAIWWLVHR